MTGYVLRRVLSIAPIMIGVSFLVFLMLHLIPGDVAEIMAARSQAGGGPEAVARVRHELGLDVPFHEQYVRFAGRALTGDLGRSYYTNRPVLTSVLEMLPHTVRLALAAMAITVVAGVGLGLLAAVYHDTWVDRAAMLLSLGGLSIPIFWSGLLLILLFAVTLGWLPITGGTEWQRLILPAAALGYDGAAFVARLTRSSMLEVLRQDYITTARAKGLRAATVVFQHAFRNAMLPVLTLAGLQFGRLLGGAVVAEAVFARPGVGRLVIDAILFKDYLLVQGVVLFVALTYAVVNLVVDLLYVWVDPRIRYT
jgi:ABC-type dipeptide/oligopeptide/nickel transport system permease component